MAEDKMNVSDKLDASVVKSVEQVKLEPKVVEQPKVIPTTAAIHILTLPPTTSPTDLIIDDLIIGLPANQPTCAVEVNFPFTTTYGRIKRVFQSANDPNIPGSVNLFRE